MKRTISFFGFMRHGGSMVFIGAFLALTLESFGQKTNPPVDPMEQSKRIDAELQKLDQTPIVQKITDMEKKFGKNISNFIKPKLTKITRRNGRRLKVSVRTNGPSNERPWLRRQRKSMRLGTRN
jgi:hypothetical protein